VEPPTRRLTGTMKSKTVMIAGFIFVILLILIARLFYVQVLCQDFWQKKAVAQQLSDIEVKQLIIKQL
jgi:cell division protein FtsI/penicillin-binding protein 2